MKYQGAGDNCKHGFKTHEQRSDRRLRVLLPYHLKRISYPAGYDAAIDYRYYSRDKFIDRGRFQYTCCYAGSDCSRCKLYCRNTYSISTRRKMIAAEDMKAEKEGADTNINIA